MTLFIGETIERMGKREEWSHEILIARFLTVVRACDREFANGTRLSTAPSFPPLEERGGDRRAGKSRRRSSSLSLPLVFLRVHRVWEDDNAPVASRPIRLTRLRSRSPGEFSSARARVTRAPSSPPSSLLSSSRV